MAKNLENTTVVVVDYWWKCEENLPKDARIYTDELFMFADEFRTILTDTGYHFVRGNNHGELWEKGDVVACVDFLPNLNFVSYRHVR